MNRIVDFSDVKRAVSNSAVSGAMVGMEISARGYGRARFIFTFGLPNANGSLGSAGIWVAGGTAGAATTYSSVSSAQLTARSSLALSNQVAVIDMAVPVGSYWLQVSGAILSNTNVPLAAVCELYQPISIPVSGSALETVTVN